eukprot:CCRYP_011935-RA/>CCRYP_011935-RA protein AED:0.39 eAED:0.85 QI:87/0/0/1/0/0/2/87/17
MVYWFGPYNQPQLIVKS